MLIEKFKVEANVKDVDDFISVHNTLEETNKKLFD